MTASPVAAPLTVARGPSRPKRLVVLGATGSIGDSTLDLVARAPEHYEIAALTANGNVDKLATLARRFRPRFVAVGDARLGPALAEALSGSGIAHGAGPQALNEAATVEADLVVSAIMGAAGLPPTLAAIEAGRDVALANKETLVTAGDLVTRRCADKGVRLLPVDSEHNAIFQVFDAAAPGTVDTVILTASGGPFRTWDKAAIAAATPAQALKHPKWTMGAKITIDSASLMNKGLELIEALHLFPITHHQLDVLVHPQSIIHGLVSYRDGSVLAQMGAPDMRTPISYCLGWPERRATPSARLDLTSVATLTFEAPDLDRFPCLALAKAAMARGGTATAVLNAANEVAVAAFLAERLTFGGIAETVAAAMEAADRRGALLARYDLSTILAIDADARRWAEGWINDHASKR
jgi:1-deoxy-D-xylulose-5-phosphate reductoisomerase